MRIHRRRSRRLGVIAVAFLLSGAAIAGIIGLSAPESVIEDPGPGPAKKADMGISSGSRSANKPSVAVVNVGADGESGFAVETPVEYASNTSESKPPEKARDQISMDHLIAMHGSAGGASSFSNSNTLVSSAGYASSTRSSGGAPGLSGGVVGGGVSGGTPDNGGSATPVSINQPVQQGNIDDPSGAGKPGVSAPGNNDNLIAGPGTPPNPGDGGKGEAPGDGGKDDTGGPARNDNPPANTTNPPNNPGPNERPDAPPLPGNPPGPETPGPDTPGPDTPGPDTPGPGPGPGPDTPGPDNPVDVPEPASIFMMLTGLALIGAVTRKRKSPKA